MIADWIQTTHLFIMKWIFISLFLFPLFIVMSVNLSLTDVVENYQCFENYQLEFVAECPPDEQVVIEEVYYAISQDMDCPVYDPNPFSFNVPRCIIEAMTSLMLRVCTGKNSCNLNLFQTSDTDTCTGFTGRHYMEVKYKCDPSKLP